jgi:hypothetical protein
MRRLLTTLQAVSVLVCVSSPAGAQGPEFGRLVARLSEPGGYFDSDNLVSNETSYLHVIPALRALGVHGGAYVGVGPEQSFSYIAQIKPEVAILVDIRRDNMLLHLLFKAMFGAARNRMEFLTLLYGRPVPRELEMWTELPLEQILTYLSERPGDPLLHGRNHAALMEQVSRYGVPLDSTDRATLRRFHDEFMIEGVEIRFTSRGRPARMGYPSAAQLYLATDLEGRQASYLATEDAFRVVRDLHRRDRIIPAVGDLSGPTAMPAIASYLRERKLPVSAFYVSNVEMYLFRQGTFPRFAENVKRLPAGRTSVLIRSYFGRGRFGLDTVTDFPQVIPGHLSAQMMQPFSAFLEVTARPDAVSYSEVLMRGATDLRAPARPGRRRRGARSRVAA